MRIFRLILLIAACLAAPLHGNCALPTWETVEAYSPSTASEIDKLEVSVRDGFIYVSTPKAVKVKVMSLLGQTISEQSLPAGVSRLKMSARGIYILKAGDATVRVTI